MRVSVSEHKNKQNQKHKHTLCVRAAFKNRVDLVRCLLDNGAKMDAKRKDGSTALHCASQEGFIDVVKLLLDRGANVHAANNEGGTALHVAANNNRAGVAALLISRGAVVDAVGDNDATPLHAAAGQKNEKIENAVFVVCFHNGMLLVCGHILVATVLLKNGANINADDRWRDTVVGGQEVWSRAHGRAAQGQWRQMNLTICIENNVVCSE